MKILLAVDGSEFARAAVDFVARFPFNSDGEVTVISVLTNVVSPDEAEELSQDQRTALEESRTMAAKEAEEYLENQAKPLLAAGWSVSTLLKTGDPAEQIVNTAAELSVDLVVVGSHGMTGVKKFLMGSVSSHVLHYSSCSVLVVRPGDLEKVDFGFPAAGGDAWRMLVAYDNSVPAKRAAAFCESLPLSDAVSVDLLSVQSLVHMFRQDIRLQLNDIYQESKSAARRALESVHDDTSWKTAKVEAHLKESDNVANAILKMAEDKSSDLIVLGDKGKGAVKRFLLGSVTRKVAHHANCSVLTVR